MKKRPRRNGKKKLNLFRLTVGLLLVAALLLGLKYGVEVVWDLVSSLATEKSAEVSEGAEQVSEKLDSEELASDSGYKVGRNGIYDRNYREMAISFPTRSLYVKPLELSDQQGVAEKLADLLELDERQLAATLASERGFSWLRRNLDLTRAEEIEGLDIPGLYLEEEEVRYYPGNRLASHVIGFLEEEQGLAGIESFYDNLLSNGLSPDAANLTAAGIEPLDLGVVSGGSVVLSLNLDIQAELEKRLSRLTKETGARAAMGLIMDPDSGEILALANLPSFDANFFWKYTNEEWRNRVVTQPLKPAALLKLFQMAAELEQGNSSFLEKNPQEVAARIISPRRLKIIKTETMSKPLSQAWNKLGDGVWWSGQPIVVLPTLDNFKLIDFAERYGLRGSNGLDLPLGQGETIDLQHLGEESSWFGSPTLLDLLAGFSRLLNHGKAMRPHLLKEILLDGQDQRIPSSLDQSMAMGSPKLSMDFLDLLVQLSAGQTRHGVFVESLAREEDEVVAQVLEVEKASASSGDHVGELVQEDARYQAMIIGGAPRLRPELTMAMVLDGARIELDKKSSMRSMAERTLVKALGLKGLDHSISQATPKPYEQYYREWSKLQEKGQPQTVGRSLSKIMPDVTGLSLRKALQTLQDINLQIKVNGSGRVVRQRPTAGSMIKDRRDCFLELQVEN